MGENHGALEGAVSKVTKSKMASPKDVSEIAHESVYGTHLRMLLKMLTDPISGILKREGKSALSSATGHGQGSSNGTTLNEFEGVLNSTIEVASGNTIASTF